jgi:hypothetical protein
MNQKLKYFVLVSISLLITQQVNALENRAITNNQNLTLQDNLISYKCPNELKGKDGYSVYSSLKSSQKFYQVRTESGELRIRKTPGGNIIGAIPNGWQVYVAKFDRTRKWAYIRDVNSPYYNTDYGFGSAPNFRSDGWVSTDHLIYVGEYCAKPNLLALLPDDLPISLKDEHLEEGIWYSLQTEILAKLNE